MKTLTLHSKLIDLQGQIISAAEGERILAQIRKALDLIDTGEISLAEAGKSIRKAAWRIAEDLRINGLALSSGSDQSFIENLPQMLKR